MKQHSDWLSIIIGTGLALLSIAMEPFLAKTGLDSATRGHMTLALAVVCLMSGFLFALHARVASVKQAMDDLATRLRTEIPQLSAFKVIDADAALRYIQSQLAVTRNMLNTRVASSGRAGYATAAGTSYRESIDAALRSGLQLRELVNEPWVASAKERREQLAATRSHKKGTYDVQCLRAELPSFMNFAVLEFIGGQKEVLFGWAITKGRGFEQKCFVTSEASVVNFFEAWFNDLYSAASNL